MHIVEMTAQLRSFKPLISNGDSNKLIFIYSINVGMV